MVGSRPHFNSSRKALSLSSVMDSCHLIVILIPMKLSAPKMAFSYYYSMKRYAFVCYANILHGREARGAYPKKLRIESVVGACYCSVVTFATSVLSELYYQSYLIVAHCVSVIWCVMPTVNIAAASVDAAALHFPCSSSVVRTFLSNFVRRFFTRGQVPYFCKFLNLYHYC